MEISVDDIHDACYVARLVRNSMVKTFKHVSETFNNTECKHVVSEMKVIESLQWNLHAKQWPQLQSFSRGLKLHVLSGRWIAMNTCNYVETLSYVWVTMCQLKRKWKGGSKIPDELIVKTKRLSCSSSSGINRNIKLQPHRNTLLHSTNLLRTWYRLSPRCLYFLTGRPTL